MTKFVISGLPMPPSSNHQYAAMAIRGQGGAWFGKIRPTRELEQYVSLFAKWTLGHNVLMAKAKKFVRDECLMKGLMVQCDTYVAFPGTSLWTQKGMPKKMDASNRLKAMHDCLAETLQIDDSYFWSGYVEKLETRKDPWVFVVLKPFAPRAVADINQETL